MVRRRLFLFFLILYHIFPKKSNLTLHSIQYSWITAATTVASGYSYVGGASLIAGEIRGVVKKEICTMKEKAKVREDKIRVAVRRKMSTLEKQASALRDRARRKRER
jgi:hypothetical protein